ncbi:MAG TPA: hypothetical protein VMF66_16170 [Candidatus Acidoferrum sp.]|nr:hypothetical protein [Candidatus Acidoferrum sp.]
MKLPARVLVISGALLLCSVTLYAKAGTAEDAASRVPAAATEENGVVSPGTHFLIRLDSAISTRTARAGMEFTAHTLDPISTPDGLVLRPGVEIRGHVDKVDQAHEVGRARLWLAFDDISTPRGWLSLIAMVSDVPGLHSVRAVYDREGEIENTTSKREDEAEAAAAGALVGAAPGAAQRNGKAAAIGAATGAATAFMISSGLGQELTLEKNTKLELVLDHPLYLAGN